MKYLFNRATASYAAALVFIMFMVSTGPSYAYIPEFDTPTTKKQETMVSTDGRVTVYFDSSKVGVPPVDRYAAIWEVVDEHFPVVGRQESVLEIHFVPYKKFIRRIGALYASAGVYGVKDSLDEGLQVIRAHTYKKSGSGSPATLVIESYQPMNDLTFVHELIHHYLEKLSVTGALNDHLLVDDYAIHVETTLRFMLGKLY